MIYFISSLIKHSSCLNTWTCIGNGRRALLNTTQDVGFGGHHLKQSSVACKSFVSPAQALLIRGWLMLSILLNSLLLQLIKAKHKSYHKWEKKGACCYHIPEMLFQALLEILPYHAVKYVILESQELKATKNSSCRRVTSFFKKSWVYCIIVS